MGLELIAWEPIAAALVAVVGWYVMHRSQLKAQKEQLRHQVLNEARVEITDSIRSYQSWLSSLSGALLSTSAFFSDSEHIDIGWPTRYKEWTSQLNQRHEGKNWLAALEEYDILFPEFRRARRELAERHKEMERRVRSITADLREFLYAEKIPKLAAVGSALHPTAVFILDQAALMEDLRVHLQNRALGEITGNEAPVRVPEDPNVPKLGFDEHGQLRIIEPRQLPPGDSNAV